MTDRVAKSNTGNRKSLFDFMDETQQGSSQNKYCEKVVLRNEASVEEFFVSRLLRDLGYLDEEIRLKSSLDAITVAKGRTKETYRPDFALVCNEKARWVIDAKEPGEDVSKWSYQGAGYAFGINGSYDNENPCQYYAITNGFEFHVWKWDEKNTPVLKLSFADFIDDNPDFLALQSLLGAKIARNGWVRNATIKSDSMVLKKPRVEEIKRVFNQCHQLIWKTEKMNPQPAFFEFVKIMFVKLWEDRKLHDDTIIGPMLRDNKPIPKDRIVFSQFWIDALQKSGVENPIDSILFKNLSDTIKEGVVRGKKKPIFEETEHIRLQVGTIKQVVSKLESYDMFGIDEDLNGRLFETFLSATMRGQSLGQYFTPRSIAKLMTRLASPRATRAKVDRILDACCGTGGFLIEVLTDMRNEIRANSSLTETEAAELIDKVANESIFGIDAGREPPIARIARINMYLHGDGGSRIYAADSLDKTAQTGVENDAQSKLEMEELRALTLGIKSGEVEAFDIVLSNPPFSMGYQDLIESESKILRQYDLSAYGLTGTNKRRSSLTSNIMFIERYADLLKEGGKLITVIDDSVLSGPKYSFARDYMRNTFIVKAVISLPGDAFQRVGARAKTSVIYLEKRKKGQSEQPSVFMTECQSVGLDDLPVKTRPSKVAEARVDAENEMKLIVANFQRFLNGEKGEWLVSGKAITSRLDVKHCLPRVVSIEAEWEKAGIKTVPLKEIVDHITGNDFNPNEKSGTTFTLLRVRYDGVAEEGEKALGEELTYTKVQNPEVDDLVVSNIAAGLGSVCIIPAHLVNTIVSSEFTIMRLKDDRFNRWFVWGFLRSVEVRARLLSSSSGTNRQRIGWGDLNSLPVPLIDKKIQDEIGAEYQASVEGIAEAERRRKASTNRMNTILNLENEWAVQRLKSAKPPK